MLTTLVVDTQRVMGALKENIRGILDNPEWPPSKKLDAIRNNILNGKWDEAMVTNIQMCEHRMLEVGGNHDNRSGS